MCASSINRTAHVNLCNLPWTINNISYVLNEPYRGFQTQYIPVSSAHFLKAWWRHQMKTFLVLLPYCAAISPVPGEFTSQRPVARSFDVFFDLRPNTQVSKQSWGWLSETPSSSLWRQCNGLSILHSLSIKRASIEKRICFIRNGPCNIFCRWAKDDMICILWIQIWINEAWKIKKPFSLNENNDHNWIE